ncbi:MAG: DsbA family protein, partial [Pseudorhodoplanes sp.]
NPRVSVMVLDACRDNPFPRVGTRSVGLARGLAEPTQGRGIFTFYSAGIGQSALDRLQQDDRDRNSVFTRVLVEYLAKPGMHLGEIAIEVRERVAALALRARDEQGSPLPHEQTPAYYDQTRGGRIYLAGLPAAGPPARSPSIDATPPAAAVDPAQIAFDHAKSVGTVEAMEAFTQLFKSGPLVDRANDEIYTLTTKRVASVIEVSRDALFRSRAQVTLGNPDGDVTLVQFLDYNCEHCRRAVEDLTTLLKTDPGLRVVLKDLPILGPASTDVGRIAIALAMHDASGKRYFNFHQKMYASRGKIDRARALSVVSEVGADRARVEKESAGSAVSDMLKENLKLAQDLGIHGTPSYLVNDQLIVGAVGLAELRKSIGYARCGKPTC